MAQKSDPEIRESVRYAMTGDLSSHLVIEEGRAPFMCAGIDVSRDGMGVTASERLPVSTRLILVIKDRGIPLEVIWCNPDLTEDGVFRIGLRCHDPKYNLVNLMKDEGLVKGRPGAPPVEEDAASGEIDFDNMREQISILHHYDQDLLRKLGLEKLKSAYRAYPMAFGGLSLLVLLPSDVKPRDASKYAARFAARKVIILSLQAGQCIKVWPRSK